MTIDFLFQKIKASPLFWVLKAACLCVLLLLVAGLAWKSVSLSYLYLPSLENTGGVSSAAGKSQQASTYQLAPGVSGLNLFGEYKADVAPPPEPEKPKPVQKPRAKLVLTGLLDMGDPKLSSAVISQQGAASKVYGVGDELPGKAKLLEVHGDHVVISYSGVEEKLWFDKNQPAVQTAKPAPARVAAARPTPVKPAVSSRYMDGFGSPASGGISGLTKSLSGKATRQNVSDYYDALSRVPNTELFNTIATEFKSNPDNVTKQLGLKPMRNRGYLVTSKIPKKYIDLYQLKYGDRILEINGQQLGDPRKDKQVFDSVREASQATVRLQRGRQITTITVPVTN